MTDEIVVLELRDTSPERRRGYEIALDRGALTAFTSWVESRPSPRARRRSVSAYAPMVFAQALIRAMVFAQALIRRVSTARRRPGSPPATE